MKKVRKTKNAKRKDRKTKIAVKTEIQKISRKKERQRELPDQQKKLARKTEKIAQQPKNNAGKTKKIAGEEGPCTFYGCAD